MIFAVQGGDQKAIGQYDAYEPIAGMHIRGPDPGENIGDLARPISPTPTGLVGGRAPVIEVIRRATLYMGYAQVWRTSPRRRARQRLTTDPHSPGEYRPRRVRNADGWYAAFNVRRGRTLSAAGPRVVVW